MQCTKKLQWHYVYKYVNINFVFLIVKNFNYVAPEKSLEIITSYDWLNQIISVYKSLLFRLKIMDSVSKLNV